LGAGQRRSEADPDFGVGRRSGRPHRQDYRRNKKPRESHRDLPQIVAGPMVPLSPKGLVPSVQPGVGPLLGPSGFGAQERNVRSFGNHARLQPGADLEICHRPEHAQIHNVGMSQLVAQDLLDAGDRLVDGLLGADALGDDTVVALPHAGATRCSGAGSVQDQDFHSAVGAPSLRRVVGGDRARLA
jgi:hypothetical protein